MYLRHLQLGSFRSWEKVDLALRQRFRTLHPGRADEDVPVHTHALTPRRPGS